MKKKNIKFSFVGGPGDSLSKITIKKYKDWSFIK